MVDPWVSCARCNEKRYLESYPEVALVAARQQRGGIRVTGRVAPCSGITLVGLAIGAGEIQ
jgi:hypothetical protein